MSSARGGDSLYKRLTDRLARSSSSSSSSSSSTERLHRSVGAHAAASFGASVRELTPSGRLPPGGFVEISTEQGASTFEGIQFRIGTSQIMGQEKDAIEDKAFARPGLLPGVHAVGVVDGHGGDACAEFVARELHEELAARLTRAESRLLYSGDFLEEVCLDAYAAVDARWNDSGISFRSGAVAATAVVVGTRVTVANCGDVRIIVSHPSLGFIQVTKDHRCDDPEEHARVLAAGATVVNQRVDAALTPTRAFGDLDMKPIKDGKRREAIIAVPDVATFNVKLDRLTNRTVMIVCSDGVFDALENKEVFQIVQSYLASRPDDADGAARALAKRASKSNGDDITAVVCLWSQVST